MHATELPSERPADAICHEESKPDIVFCHPQQLLEDQPCKYEQAMKSNKNRKYLFCHIAKSPRKKDRWRVMMDTDLFKTTFLTFVLFISSFVLL